MPKYEVEIEYTVSSYAVVTVEAEDEAEAEELAFEEAELPSSIDEINYYVREI